MGGITKPLMNPGLDEYSFRTACEKVFDRLQDLTPVDTGRAQASWRMDWTPERCIFINDAPYSEYLDGGSSKQAPNGMTEPAFREFENQVPTYQNEFNAPVRVLGKPAPNPWVDEANRRLNTKSNRGTYGRG